MRIVMSNNNQLAKPNPHDYLIHLVIESTASYA